MVHVELQPEAEAQLAAEAQARGLALNRYIEEIVESAALSKPSPIKRLNRLAKH